MIPFYVFLFFICLPWITIGAIMTSAEDSCKGWYEETE